MDTTTHPEPTELDDPRVGLAAVVGALRPMVTDLDPTDLAATTPCPEFDVEALVDHVIDVMGRAAAIGRGEPWSTDETPSFGTARASAFDQAAHALRDAWTDPERLGRTYEVPWATLPGAALLASFTGELAVHGWDLATALGTTFEVDDELLEGALVAVRQIPAEGRDAPEMPFDPVVDPGPGASRLLQMAGWSGRQVA